MIAAADWMFLLARAVQAVLFIPLALAILLTVLLVMSRTVGMGKGGLSGLRELFDSIEQDPRAVATYFGAVVIAAAMIVSALVR